MIWRSSLNSFLAQLADFATFYSAYAIAFNIWVWAHMLYPAAVPSAFPVTNVHYVLVAVLSMTCVLFFRFQKAYSYQRFTSLSKEYLICLKVSALNFLFGVTLIFLIGYRSIPRTILLLGLLVSLGLSMLQKTALFYAASTLRKKGRNRKRILLIGTGTRAKQFIETVMNNFQWGLDIVGLLTGDETKVGKSFYGVKVIDMYDKMENILRIVNPEEVIITISTKRFDQIRDILECCEREGVQVRLNSDFFGYLTKNVSVDNVYGLNIISFQMLRHSEVQLLVKRTVDIVGAALALIVFSPFMATAFLGILISDGWPVMYEWNVFGFNKKPIKSWKFRTMVRNADDLKPELLKKNEMEGPVFKMKNDPRIFPFGKWLRKWSIDETPQLFSVLKGDLSLVGPRPAGANELAQYKSWHRRKLSAKPGLTCLWQVNGRSKISSFDEWVKLDLEYIDNWSLWLDLKILIKTIPVVLFGKGAS